MDSTFVFHAGFNNYGIVEQQSYALAPVSGSYLPPTAVIVAGPWQPTVVATPANLYSVSAFATQLPPETELDVVKHEEHGLIEEEDLVQLDRTTLLKPGSTSTFMPRFNSTHSSIMSSAVSDLPSGDMDPLPDATTMNHLLKVAWDRLFPYAMLFAPSARDTIRRRSPTTLWALAALGAALDDPPDPLHTLPFLQRLSKVWTLDKGADGKHCRLITAHPYGEANSLGTVQALGIMMGLLATSWAHQNMNNSTQLFIALQQKSVEALNDLHLVDGFNDERRSEMEREERRRAAVIGINVEVWSSLYLLKKKPVVSGQELNRLKTESSDAPGSSDGVVTVRTPQPINSMSYKLPFDKEALYACVGEVAEFNALTCCEYSEDKCCRARRNAIQAKFEAWFASLPPWAQQLDIFASPPRMDMFGMDSHESWCFDVTWMCSFFQLYHSAILSLLKPRTGVYSAEWCAREEFLISSEHAIRSAALAKLALDVDPKMKFSAPWLPYALLQPALVHRSYVDYMGPTLPHGSSLGSVVGTNANQEQLLKLLVLKEAKDHCQVLLKALRVLCQRWNGANQALERYRLGISW